MNFVILDLEWNSGYSKKKHSFINEIIEFGAVKLDDDLNMTGQFSIFIRPEITKRLNRTVKELTSLTNDDLKYGATFPYAVSKFKKFSDGCVIMTWSKSDLAALETNCEYYFGSERIPFLKQYADLQAYCQDILELPTKNQIALQGAAEHMGISTDDIPLHRAVGDSILSARCLKKLYDKEKFSSYIKPCDDEFYGRLNFRNTYITSIDNPLIDKSELTINCEYCGNECTRLNEWKTKNKSFAAHFKCRTCNKKYNGKVQFRLSYDGVTVIKKLTEITENDSKDQTEQSDPTVKPDAEK